jgi:hypothetical protein
MWRSAVRPKGLICHVIQNHSGGGNAAQAVQTGVMFLSHRQRIGICRNLGNGKGPNNTTPDCRKMAERYCGCLPKQPFNPFMLYRICPWRCWPQHAGSRFPADA